MKVLVCMTCVVLTRGECNCIYELYDGKHSYLLNGNVVLGSILNNSIYVPNLQVKDNKSLVLKAKPEKDEVQAMLDKYRYKELEDNNEDSEFSLILNKYKVLGYNIVESFGIYYIFLDNNNTITILIPNKIVTIPLAMRNDTISQLGIKINSESNIKVIGGKGLLTADLMFQSCKINTLDLSKFDASNVYSTNYMFSNTDIKNLNLDNLNVQKVVDMSQMFSGAKISNLSIRNINTPNLVKADRMFHDLVSDRLSIDGLNTSKVKDFSDMFKNCEIHNLDNLRLDTRNASKMVGMFEEAKISGDLDLTSFNTSKVRNMKRMFKDCTARNINVSTFDTSSCNKFDEMFMGCNNLESLDLRNFTFNATASKHKIIYGCKTKIMYNKKLIRLNEC